MKSALTELPPQTESMLLPKGQNAGSVDDRKKHPRLMGADLYVTRLGWYKGAAAQNPARPGVRAPLTPPTVAHAEAHDGDDVISTSSSSLQNNSPSCSSGSLHDELINPEPTPRPCKMTRSSVTVDRQHIRASRPCYRCISYMHSVGIKRVFWTNDAGAWEGGKVRDLVDALESSMEDVASGGSGDRGGPMGNGVFVTKHEVLMLKRLMGEG